MTKQLLAALVLPLLAMAGCTNEDTVVVEGPPTVFGNVYGLTSSGKLVTFVGSAPGTVISSKSITGITSGESLEGIDFRPATQTLYALTTSGTTGYLYTVNAATAVATKVGALVDAPTVADSGATYTGLSGTDFAIDFNPVPDRLRIISDTGQNLRVNVDTRGVAVDTAIGGSDTTLVSAAYTNSFGGGNGVSAMGETPARAATLTTTLYAIDATSDFLVSLASPNGGVTARVGATALPFNGGAVSAFDIDGLTGTAYAALTASGATGSRLFSVNLATGGATAVGNIGGGEAIVGLAIPVPEPVVAFGVNDAGQLVSFTPSSLNLAAPITPAPVVAAAISGLGDGETIVGMDFRPLTGQLYALGSTGQLYTLDTATAAATAVGSPLSLGANTGFGFDFNPTVDRIRIVGNMGLNLRVNPDSGVAATDTALAENGVVAVAYNRNYMLGAATTLYGIQDAGSVAAGGNDELVTIGGQDGNPSPNGGTFTASTLLNPKYDAATGFDIVGGHDGMQLATAAGTSATEIYVVPAGLVNPTAPSSDVLVGSVAGGLKAFTLRLVRE